MIYTAARLRELIEKDTKTARKLSLVYPEESGEMRELVRQWQELLEYAEEIERLNKIIQKLKNKHKRCTERLDGCRDFAIY